MTPCLVAETAEFCEFWLFGSPYRFKVSPKHRAVIESRDWCVVKSKNVLSKLYVVDSKTKAYLHRILADLEGIDTSREIDHKDSDSLNNCIENLRAATHAENTRNKKKNHNNKCGHKGIWLHKGTGKFRAEVISNGVRFDLGLFSTREQAASVREAFIKIHHGEFARQD